MLHAITQSKSIQFELQDQPYEVVFMVDVLFDDNHKFVDIDLRRWLFYTYDERGYEKVSCGESEDTLPVELEKRFAAFKKELEDSYA
jgi:hypothetical protein